MEENEIAPSPHTVLPCCCSIMSTWWEWIEKEGGKEGRREKGSRRFGLEGMMNAELICLM